MKRKANTTVDFEVIKKMKHLNLILATYNSLLNNSSITKSARDDLTTCMEDTLKVSLKTTYEYLELIK